MYEFFSPKPDAFCVSSSGKSNSVQTVITVLLANMVMAAVAENTKERSPAKENVSTPA